MDIRDAAYICHPTRAEARRREFGALGLDSPWGSFPLETRQDRDAWFNFHGEKIAQARGAFIIALEAYAKEIIESGAHEGPFKFDDFMSGALDNVDAWLAEEAREWLGA